jgi:hypothetical protein
LFIVNPPVPKIAVYKYFVFFIIAFDLKERFHIHVAKTKSRESRAAKFWLEPVEIVERGDLTKAEMNLAVKLIRRNKEEIKRKIINFAEGKRSKPLSLKLK